MARWLALEAELESRQLEAGEHEPADRAALAEDALAQVIDDLPEMAPSAGFAARVLAARASAVRAARVELRRAVRDLDDRWRVLTAAALALGALSLALLWSPLRSTLLQLEPLSWPATLLDVGAVVLSSAVKLASALLVWLDWLAPIGRAASAVLLAPPTLSLLSFSTVLTLVVGRWLVHTLSVQRSPAHG